VLEGILSANGLALVDIKQHISAEVAHNAKQCAINGTPLGAERFSELQSGIRALQEGGVAEAIAAAKAQGAAEKQELITYTKDAWGVLEGIRSANRLAMADINQHISYNLARNAKACATRGRPLDAERLSELQSGIRALQEGGVAEAIAAAKAQGTRSSRPRDPAVVVPSRSARGSGYMGLLWTCEV
jgi:hypothetical protein